MSGEGKHMDSCKLVITKLAVDYWKAGVKVKAMGAAVA